MTKPVLALVHTIPANIEAFDALAGELAPEVPIRHAMHDGLLKEALEAGEDTPSPIAPEDSVDPAGDKPS